jgi:hypothetical protein
MMGQQFAPLLLRSMPYWGQWRRCILSLVFLALPLFAFLSFLSPSYADRFNESAPLVSTEDSTYNAAMNAQWHGTLQVAFPTIMADRNKNPFERLFELIPSHFPNFKLNTLGRNLHSTILYLDGLSVDKAREIIAFMKGANPALLARYNLVGRFKYFDPSQPVEMFITGNRTRFIAYKPHREFIEWQSRFWAFLKDHYPELLAWHMSHRGLGEELINPEHAHMSLAQYQAEGSVYAPGEEPSGYAGPVLNPQQGAAEALRMQELLQGIVDDMKSQGLPLESLYFDTSEQPLELVAPPESIFNPPLPFVTFITKNGRYSASNVGVLKVTTADGQNRRVVEFNINNLVSGQGPVTELRDDFVFDWFPESRRYPALTEAEFKSRLSPRMQEVMTRSYLTLSPTKHPAVVTDTGGKEYFITNMTHPMLKPEKTFSILGSLRPYLPDSNESVSVGSALYASSGREEILNPGDADVLVNSLIHVPSEVDTFEAAERYAVQHFVQHVLGHFLNKCREGSMAFIELRIGSRYTMGDYNVNEDLVEALMDNPYLSEQDLMRGYWTDRNGRQWTIEQLVALGDFLKGKVDLFNADGTRTELSLQFLSGFSWRGSTHFMQRNGLKGVPPLMRTAVYDDARSFAVASTLARPSDYVGIRRGPLLARAIGDLLKAVYPNNHFDERPPVLSQPLWSSKTLKKMYNFIVLLQRSNLGLDEYFLTETRRVLEREGRWTEGYNFKHLKDVLLVAVNQDAIRLLNALKRNVNDLREYNERSHTLRRDQWESRKSEIQDQIRELDELLSSEVVTPGRQFRAAYDAFKATFERADQMSSASRAIRFMRSRARYNELLDFENALVELEDHFNASAFSRAAITEADQLFLQTMVSYSPLFLYRYGYNRNQDRGNIAQWALRFMKISIDDTNRAVKFSELDRVAENLDRMTRAEVAESQKRIFSKSPHPPLSGSYQPCVDALTPPGHPTQGDS